MLRSDIPKVLLSCIKEDDPYRAPKAFQIERWCYANWDLHSRSGPKEHDVLARVLSSEDCWKKVDDVRGVKLDRHVVGKKLIAPDTDNLFDNYIIACRCCLEDDIVALFEEKKQRLSGQGERSLPDHELVKCLATSNDLTGFWSHFVSGYMSKLNLNGRHPYEYGLKCAMDLKKLEAVEYFWNKMKSLPEDELSAQQKDEIFMKTAVRAAGSRFSNYPEIFEFCFSQISPDKHKELLKSDLAENRYYGSLGMLQDTLRFDHFRELFDCLKSSDVSEDEYYIWLKYMKDVQKYSECYVDSAVKLFMHMWTKEGFDSHRALLLKKEMTSNSVFQGRFLVPLVNRGCMEPVWAVLAKAASDQIKEFMGSRHANLISSTLKERGDEDSLNKFLSYSIPIVKELERMVLTESKSLNTD